MVARRLSVFSKSTRAVCEALGTEVSRVRRERRWSQSELAGRIGVSLGTLRSIEQGSPSVTLGAAIEAASVLGIDLLGGTDAATARAADNRHTLSLLPQRIRAQAVDDDF